jgi:hypothetical protein
LWAFFQRRIQQLIESRFCVLNLPRVHIS